MPKPSSGPTAVLAPTARTLPMTLLRARETVMERFRPMLHRHDVTEQQWRVLRVLHERDEMDASELARGASILAPSLTRILKALEARALIELRKDPDDGRRTVIRLSANGSAFLAGAAPESAAIYEEIEALVGRAEIERLIDDMDRLIEALSNKK